MKCVCMLMMAILLITPSYARHSNAMEELTRLNNLVEDHLQKGAFEKAKAVAQEASFLATHAEVLATVNGEARHYGFSVTKANKEQAQKMTRALSLAVNLGSYQEDKADTAHKRAIQAIVDLAKAINPMQFAKKGYQVGDSYNLKFEPKGKRRNEVRATLFAQTQWILANGRYIIPEGTIVLDKAKQSVMGSLRFLPNAVVTDFIQPGDRATKTYPQGLKEQAWSKVVAPTKIEVWNADSLDAYLTLNPDERKKAAVVDFANAISPGGGPEGGAAAQEEQICYRTNLYPKLSQAFNDDTRPYAIIRDVRRGLDRDFAVLGPVSPREGSDSGLYVPQVTIFRSNALTPETRRHLKPAATQKVSSQYSYPYALYEPIEGPAIIVSAAINLNEVPAYKQLFWKEVKKDKDTLTVPISSAERIARAEGNSRYKSFMESYRTLTKHKIRFQLRAALKDRKTVLITGAFGCGVFGNLPDVMAELYREVLGEDEFQGAFERIIFANLVNWLGGPNFTEFDRVFVTSSQ